MVAAVLGPRPYLNVYGGNLNYPGSATQEVHMDGVWQFPSQDAAAAAGVATWPPPPHQLIAQVCPMGSTALNATEIWPGSHHVVELADTNKFTDDGQSTRERYAAAAAARVASHPPLRLVIPPGAVGFRDSRTWHRGMPNRGDAPRPMIALQYASDAVRDDLVANSTQLRSRVGPTKPIVHNGLEVNDNDRHVVFSEECRGVFETPSTFGVDRNAAFAPPPLDYNGLPGVVPTELPPVPRGVELPLWLDSYLQKNGRTARL